MVYGVFPHRGVYVTYSSRCVRENGWKTFACTNNFAERTLKWANTTLHLRRTYTDMSHHPPLSRVVQQSASVQAECLRNQCSSTPTASTNFRGIPFHKMGILHCVQSISPIFFWTTKSSQDFLRKQVLQGGQTNKTQTPIMLPAGDTWHTQEHTNTSSHGRTSRRQLQSCTANTNYQVCACQLVNSTYSSSTSSMHTYWANPTAPWWSINSGI